MRDYKRRWQAWWMTLDKKPKGTLKRLIEKANRQEAKNKIRKEMEKPKEN
jgi:hypothetical protein